MKKFSILLSVFVLIVASLACVLPTPPNSTVASGDVSATPSLIPTAAPTESATAIIPAASPIPTFTSTPLPTLAAPVIANCGKHGTVAWQNDNMSSGATYGLAPVGGLEEPCWVVAQTHWKEADSSGNMVEVRAVFAVTPNSVEWIKDYLGGTGWYFGGSEADVRANLAQQAKELEERDGPMKTYIIILPGDAENFPIHDHFQTK